MALLAAAGGQQLAAGSGTVSWQARGPVRFSIRSYAADVQIFESSGNAVTVSGVRGAVRLVSGGGDRVEAEFGGKRQLHDGKVTVSLPRGSSVDAGSVSGDVLIYGVGGEVRIRGMSGRISVTSGTDVDAENVDGSVEIHSAIGALRVHTVSGRILVTSPAHPAKLEAETASGSLDFRGNCAAGCHIDVDSVSGDVRFELDADSSLAARVVSTSGKIRDEAGLSFHRKAGASEGDFSEGALGKADGLIECETFSGNVTFVSR